MKVPTHRIVQMLGALAGGGVGGGVVVSDPHSVAGWVGLVCGAIIAVVTFVNHVYDPQQAPPVQPPAPPA